MYGVVQRPTHRNTSLEAAQFEGSGHRFADLSEPGYGVAILNNAKYGYGAIENVLTLSLLRGPLYPDALADEGEHHFTYSLFPHEGDWTSGGVTSEAIALNSPLVVLPAAGDGAEEAGLVTLEGVSLALGALKPADGGDGLILRIYEPHGGRGKAKLRFAKTPARVERVDLLEETTTDGSMPDVAGNTVTLNVRPFEVTTLRLVF
jgi:alpha-mannosidase